MNLSDIRNIKKDFDSKVRDDMRVNDACESLGLKNIWKTEMFNGKIGKDMFYRYIIKTIGSEK